MRRERSRAFSTLSASMGEPALNQDWPMWPKKLLLETREESCDRRWPVWFRNEEMQEGGCEDWGNVLNDKCVVPWAPLTSPLRCTGPWPGVHSTDSTGKEWELCAPRKNGVNTCWVLGGSVESPSQPTQVSVLCGIITSHEPCTFFICYLLFWQTISLWRKSSQYNVIQRRLTCALSSDLRDGANFISCVCQSPATSLCLPLLQTHICRLFQQKSAYLGIMDRALTVIASSRYSWGHKKSQSSFSKGFGPWHHHLGATSLKGFPEVARDIPQGAYGLKISSLMK